jgi:hypothetical protein
MIATGIAPSGEREFCSHPNPPKRPRSMRGASKSISVTSGGGPGECARPWVKLSYNFFLERKFGHHQKAAHAHQCRGRFINGASVAP